MSRKAMVGFGVLIGIIVVVWFNFVLIMQTILSPVGEAIPPWATLGAFGDTYGVLNSLFSALAFCGVAVTLYLQNAQMNHLKSQEKGTERAQALQARLMAITAALSHHNLEVARIKADLEANILKTAPNSQPFTRALHDALVANVERRNALVEELELIMKATAEPKPAA